MDRREFLGLVGLGVVAAAVPALAGRQTPKQLPAVSAPALPTLRVFDSEGVELARIALSGPPARGGRRYLSGKGTANATGVISRTAVFNDAGEEVAEVDTQWNDCFVTTGADVGVDIVLCFGGAPNLPAWYTRALQDGAEVWRVRGPTLSGETLTLAARPFTISGA